jgi:hypothetical protein
VPWLTSYHLAFHDEGRCREPIQYRLGPFRAEMLAQPQGLGEFMRRFGLESVFCLAALWPSAPLLVANEITLIDGTKFVGRVTSISFEKVEVETSDGRIQSNSTDPESIHFREGPSTQSTEANTVKADLPKIDESLHGTEYVNRTSKFSLTLPPEWIINADLRPRPVTLAGLSSRDKTRFAIVEQKEYPGSLASYKEFTMAASRITLSNFEELSQSSATIDGKRAILVLYRGNIPVPPNTSVEFVTAFISRSDNNFIKVTAWCAEPLFHDMQPAFEKLVTSYRSSARFTSDGNR